MTYSSEVLADSPLVYWRLGESSGTALADASGNGRTATLTSGTLGATGALTGDSDTAITNAIGDIADAAWMDVAGSLTVEAWYKPNSTPGNDQTMVSRYGAGGFFWQLKRTSTGAIRALVTTSGSFTVTSPSTYATGTYRHVVFVANTTDHTLKLYIDGSEVASIAMTGTLATGTRKIQLGQYSDASSTNIAGVLDEVAIYGSALSASRIANHYAAGTGAAVIHELIGTIPATSTVTGDMLANRTMAGTVAATSGVSGALTVDYQLAGTVAATSGVSANFTGSAHVLAGIVAATSDSSAAFMEVDGGVGFAEELPDLEVPAADIPDPERLIRTRAWSVPPIELDDNGRPTEAWKAGAAEFTGVFGAYRVFVGGEDVTTFRDYPFQSGTRQHADPFGYAAYEVSLPGVTPWETELWGTGAVSWMSEWAQVVLQIVDEAGNARTLWRGFVGSVSPEAQGLRLTCAGEARGRLDFDRKTVRPFRAMKDIGTALYDVARRPGLKITPPLGVETGHDIDDRSRAGGSLLEVCEEYMALSQQPDGSALTIMPTGAHGNTYHMDWRDTETIHATVFYGAYGIDSQLQSNLVDRPTTLFGTGRESDGGVWANIKAPGLFEADPPPYPGTLSSSAGSDEDINIWQSALIRGGYLKRDDSVGGFNEATEDATKDLQEDAGLSRTGVVNEATWNAGYDVGITGPTLSQAHSEPLAQDTATKRYLTTATGAIYAPNPDYDPLRPKVTEIIDYGDFSKRNARKRARGRRQKLAAAKMWAGTLRLDSDLFAGDYNHGDPDPEILSRFEDWSGKNIMLRGWDGDTLLHVAADDKDATGATLSVDTMGRPLLEVRQIIERNKEGRENPAKTFKRQHRGIELGGLGEWWSEIGGEITVRQTLEGNKWNVLDPVVAGDMGTLARVALTLEDAVEFVAVLFAIPTTQGDLNANWPDPFDQPKAWASEAVRARIDHARIVLGWWGDKDDPAGYGNHGQGHEADGDPLTGKLMDDAGLPYRTFASDDINNGRRCCLYWAIFPKVDTAIGRQRSLWPNPEVGM